MYRFLKWRDDWLLHIEDLDGEHRQLVELLNRIAERFGIFAPRDAVGAKAQGEAEIYSMLKQLGEEVRHHFRHEEALMKESDFPEYDSHRYEHCILLAEYADLLRQVDHNGMGYLDFQTLTALKTWLIGHMVGVDRAFGDYYHEMMGHSRRGKRYFSQNVRMYMSMSD
jgi:hemerythrin